MRRKKKGTKHTPIHHIYQNITRQEQVCPSIHTPVKMKMEGITTKNNMTITWGQGMDSMAMLTIETASFHGLITVN